jgi:hypothetical protein
MKLKKWFETDLGFEATKNELRKSKIAADLQDWQGRLTFHFIDLKDYTIQITTKGKLGIYYLETSNPDVALEKFKPYMVTAEGTPAKIIKPIAYNESKTDKEKPSSEKPSYREVEDAFNRLLAKGSLLYAELIANEAGCPWRDIERDAYAIAKNRGMKPATLEIGMIATGACPTIFIPKER